MNASHHPLDDVLIGGREKRDIVIVDHDPRWAERYEHERAQIVAALGGRVLALEHIGSTSVPGLAAKPIIDIDLSVADVEDEDAYVSALVAAGYVLRVREPGHRMLRTPERDVHLHVCGHGSEWERRHLVFRDWLRTHPDDRRRYEAVKRELATREWDDTNDYADAKSDVVADIMARAAAPPREE
jgi:GrpB-like predicted nucleotidyltransferase (UPF0157 family)